MQNKKALLRTHYKHLLKNLSHKRRLEASSKAYEKLIPLFLDKKTVISFASLPEELEMENINQFLLQKHLLGLFRIDHNELVPYQIHSNTSFKAHRFYKIREPLSTTQERIPLNTIDCILIPALAFDQTGIRLGRGKGYYDRFIEKLHSKKLFPKLIGIGFKEQLHLEILPKEPFDKPMDECYLF